MCSLVSANEESMKSKQLKNNDNIHLEEMMEIQNKNCM